MNDKTALSKRLTGYSTGKQTDVKMLLLMFFRMALLCFLGDIYLNYYFWADGRWRVGR